VHVCAALALLASIPHFEARAAHLTADVAAELASHYRHSVLGTTATAMIHDDKESQSPEVDKSSQKKRCCCELLDLMKMQHFSNVAKYCCDT
jgi:hypothetical protein